VLLFLIAQRRAALSALLSAAVFACIPIVLYGARVYAQWFSAVRLEGPNPQVGNAALSGLLSRLGAPGLTVPAAALGLALLAWWVWRRQPSVTTTSAAALVALLLFSPLAWVGYTVFLLPLLVVRRWTQALALAAALLFLPRRPLQELVDASPLVQLTLGSVYTLALILLLWSVLARWRSAHAPVAEPALEPRRIAAEVS
jgi:hypothetical protein